MDGLVDVLGTTWARATAEQPVPPLEQVLLTGVAALALVLLPMTWPRVRMGVTVVHESGHALVAVLVGRRLQGIRLEADTSGVTVSKGRPRGPGMVVMLAAGYLAPAVVGLGAALLLASGHSVGLLWLLVVLVLLLLVWIRNVHGLVVLLVGGGAVFLVSWYAAPGVQAAVAYLVTWLLLLAAPRPVVELLRGWRRRRRTSDPDQLAGLTHVPALLWVLVMLLANLAGLVVGVATLAPQVVHR